ncbi:hypothetical protein pVco7_gp056 [Vibrio phage pVco-7]|uniref:Uncharacterized protein n=1 Tax=Vibrio phage pVco-5 TaxID=1965485 RepID=A0A1W6JV17_9CAUD|nr:hypothetical protein KNT61_gp057 [Vibrio phage pVco-5]ARM71045.1 hypothetical protein pVco5_057 [Vibrio phage pVco-5]
MSDTNEATKVLIRVKPKNSAEELDAMFTEFDAAEELKDKTMLTVPSTNRLVTDEGHLLVVLPKRLDFAIAYEPDEFVVLAENAATA